MTKRCSTIVLLACAAFAGALAPATQPGDLTIITRQQWGSTPQPLPEARRHTPKLLTLHHAGVTWKPTGDAQAFIRNMQAWGQREKNWPDLPYHFLIAPDGRVFEGRDINFEPDTNTKYDLKGVLNIELMGNFEEQRVSPQQLRATVLLIARLCDELKLDPATIRGHNDAAPGQTSCPGRDFHRYIAKGLIRQWVDEARAGKQPNIRELEPLPNGPTSRIATTRPSS